MTIDICPICKSADIEILADYRGIHKTFSGLKRVQCRTCGMNFTSPLPAESDLLAYNASYFDSAHGGKTLSIVATSFFAGIARLRAAHLKRYLDKLKIMTSSVLEIGPGPGFFARIWLEENLKTRYMAIETDSSCYSSLREIGVELVGTSSTTNKGEACNLVVMSHVLEHVSDPEKFIRTYTKTLCKGGVLFIEVPCRDWEHKSLDEPHLLFFDKGPMCHLLNRLGFEDIEVTYHGRKIEDLRKDYFIRAKLLAIRSRLISYGVVKPFARARPGMESLINPLERAAVAPFKAHYETVKPAWWLRAVARKK